MDGVTHKLLSASAQIVETKPIFALKFLSIFGASTEIDSTSCMVGAIGEDFGAMLLGYIQRERPLSSHMKQKALWGFVVLGWPMTLVKLTYHYHLVLLI